MSGGFRRYRPLALEFVDSTLSDAKCVEVEQSERLDRKRHAGEMVFECLQVARTQRQAREGGEIWRGLLVDFNLKDFDPHKPLLHEQSMSKDDPWCRNSSLFDFRVTPGSKLNVADQELFEKIVSDRNSITLHKGASDHRLPTSYNLLLAVQLQCLIARVVRCSNVRCEHLRVALAKTMPMCTEWPLFREWVLTTVSCQLSAAYIGYKWLESFGSCHLWNLAHEYHLPDNASLGCIVYDVTELLGFWRMRFEDGVRDYLEHSYYSIRKLPEGDHVKRYVKQPIMRALSTASQLGICPKRLWDLAYMTEGAHEDLYRIIEVVKTAKNRNAFAHEGHSICNPEFCELADENSTLKTQLHKCQAKSCNDILRFSESDLVQAVNGNQRAVWSVGEDTIPKLLPVERGYIAISHVWSDGTGVGVQPAGVVNHCLASYFFKLARQLGCEGLWWDAVCIPVEKKARAKAISEIHESFSNAKHTVIHDEYLINFDWAEDGSPAVALILSPWFSRGWTALELSVSESVKVIYRNPGDHTTYVVKDLDHDILPSRFPQRLGHTAAAYLIRQLKGKPNSLMNVLKIMSTRTTSWNRDRIAILGLLARVRDFNYDDHHYLATRKILFAFEWIDTSLLHHGHTTIAKPGKFSWIPANLLWKASEFSEFRVSFLSSGLAQTDWNGRIAGQWFQYVALTADTARDVRPCMKHPSGATPILRALEETPENCILLHIPDSCLPDVLAIATDISLLPGGESCIDCHYIGCVTSLDHSAYQVGSVIVRLGHNSDKDPTKSARDYIDEYWG